MFSALDDFGIDKIIDAVNKIYDSGNILEDVTKSILVSLPKRPAANEYDPHGAISLMSHISKLMMRILTNGERSRNKAGIRQERCGFVKETGTKKRYL